LNVTHVEYVVFVHYLINVHYLIIFVHYIIKIKNPPQKRELMPLS
jgi:hypothetical protein